MLKNKFPLFKNDARGSQLGNYALANIFRFMPIVKVLAVKEISILTVIFFRFSV